MKYVTLLFCFILPFAVFADQNPATLLQQQYQGSTLTLSCSNAQNCTVTATDSKSNIFSLKAILNSSSYIRWLEEGDAFITTLQNQQTNNLYVNFHNHSILVLNADITGFKEDKGLYFAIENNQTVMCAIQSQNCYHIAELDGYVPSDDNNALTFFFDSADNLYVTNSSAETCNMYQFDYQWLLHNTTAPYKQEALNIQTVDPNSSLCSPPDSTN